MYVEWSNEKDILGKDMTVLNANVEKHLYYRKYDKNWTSFASLEDNHEKFTDLRS